MDNLKPFPDHERREVVASTKVVLPFDVVRSLPGELRKDVIAPISLKWGQIGLQIHVHVISHGGPFRFAIEVSGLDISADLYVRGQFSSITRNWLDLTPLGAHGPISGRPPSVAAPTGWLRPSVLRRYGRLAEFVFATTREITGTVSVYGPPAVTKVLPDNSRIRALDTFSDVTLRAAGKDFPAHKNVLAACSAVFLTMFTGSFKEATDKVVDITVHCSAELFGVFLDFLYTGVLNRRSGDDLMDLLDLGEQYMIEELKQQCVYQLLHMEPEQALQVFEACLKNPSLPEKIRAKAVDVIINKWTTVRALKGWEAFSSAHPDAVCTLDAFIAYTKGL